MCQSSWFSIKYIISAKGNRFEKAALDFERKFGFDSVRFSVLLVYIYIGEYVLTSAIVWTAVTSLGWNQSLDAIIEVDV